MSTDLSCPACGSEFDLVTLFASECDQQALARLVAVSFPIGTRVLQYVSLHTPAKQRLTASKKIKLLLQLLPDLEREAITYKGRDWNVPLKLWAEAFDQLLAKRDSGRIELPLKGHGYLYAVLSGLANDHEAAAERKHEADLRNTGRPHASNNPTHVGELVQNPAPRPALAPVQPGGVSPTVRAMRAALEKKQGV